MDAPPPLAWLRPHPTCPPELLTRSPDCSRWATRPSSPSPVHPDSSDSCRQGNRTHRTVLRATPRPPWPRKLPLRASSLSQHCPAVPALPHTVPTVPTVFSLLHVFSLAFPRVLTAPQSPQCPLCSQCRVLAVHTVSSLPHRVLSQCPLCPRVSSLSKLSSLVPTVSCVPTVFSLPSILLLTVFSHPRPHSRLLTVRSVLTAPQCPQCPVSNSPLCPRCP